MATGSIARRDFAQIARACALLEHVSTMRVHARAGSSSDITGGFPSDTSLVVDACIARVREVAGLDEDVVLPPLPRVAPRRDVVILTKHEMACSLGDALGAGRSLDVAPISPRRSKEVSPSPPTRASRLPLLFCALVAVASGGAAFLASPAGKAPAVVRVTSAVRAHASHAVQAVASRARP